MPSRHDPNLSPDPETPARAARWLRHVLVACALATLTATGCGSPEATTILDTERVEDAIEHSIMSQRSQRAQVSCPSGVHQKKGLVFSCTALVRSTKTRFVVTELDGAGHVRYEAP